MTSTLEKDQATLENPSPDYSTFKRFGMQDVEVWKDRYGNYMAVAIGSSVSVPSSWKFVGHKEMDVQPAYPTVY